MTVKHRIFFLFLIENSLLCNILLSVFLFYADSRGEGVEFLFYLPLVYPTFFLRLSVGSVVFVSGAYPV